MTKREVCWVCLDPRCDGEHPPADVAEAEALGRKRTAVSKVPSRLLAFVAGAAILFAIFGLSWLRGERHPVPKAPGAFVVPTP